MMQVEEAVVRLDVQLPMEQMVRMQLVTPEVSVADRPEILVHAELLVPVEMAEMMEVMEMQEQHLAVVVELKVIMVQYLEPVQMAV